MDRSEHHATAEQLLERARTVQDQSRRSMILAEAQVHAILALAAATLDPAIAAAAKTPHLGVKRGGGKDGLRPPPAGKQD